MRRVAAEYENRAGEGPARAPFGIPLPTASPTSSAEPPALGSMHPETHRDPSSRRSGGPPSRLPVPGTAGSPDAGMVAGLRILGLPRRHARLLLALAQGTPLGAREIRRRGGRPRATAYRVLARLADRGLVTTDDRMPRRFRAVPPERLFERYQRFLREEEETMAALADAYTVVPSPGPKAPGPMPGTPSRPRLLSPAGSEPHPALAELAAARHSVHLLFRPLAVSAAYRRALMLTLARLVGHGVAIRAVTDAAPVDRRMATRLLHEANGGAHLIELRHYAPVLAHLYLIDEQLSVRFPVLSSLGRSTEVAAATGDPSVVRSQLARFVAIWHESVGPDRLLDGARIPSDAAGSGSAASGTPQFPLLYRPSTPPGPTSSANADARRESAPLTPPGSRPTAWRSAPTRRAAS